MDDYPSMVSIIVGLAPPASSDLLRKMRGDNWFGKAGRFFKVDSRLRGNDVMRRDVQQVVIANQPAT